MTKGKRITIYTETIAAGTGVIDTKTMIATVVSLNGDGVTVKADDGYIYECDRNVRNDDGHYKTL